MFGFPVWKVASYELGHFLLSGLAGWLVYSWMSTTLSRTWPGGRGQTSDSSTAFFLLLLSLSAGLLFHIFEDVFVGVF